MKNVYNHYVVFLTFIKKKQYAIKNDVFVKQMSIEYLEASYYLSP